MKKKRFISSLLLAILLILNLVGCSNNEEDQSIEKQSAEESMEVSSESSGEAVNTSEEDEQVVTDSGNNISGIYEGVGYGLKSDIVVHVSLDNSKITDIDIVEEDDTVHISDAVYEKLPAQIIEAQSTNIDNISGATYTSAGVKNAVNNALESAGLDTSNYAENVNIEFEPAEDQEYDVVIVGGGSAGLSAAISLMTDDEMGLGHSGLDVLVLEKLAYTGGSLRVSDAYMTFPGGTIYNEILGDDNGTTTDEIVEYVAAQDEKGYMNEALLRKVMDYTPQAIHGLLNQGMYMPPENSQPGYAHGNEEAGLDMAKFTVRDPYTGYSSGRPEEGMIAGSNAGGPYVSQSLENAAKNTGAEIRTSAKVENLIVEDDVVKGVHVLDSNNNTEYDVYAEKVIVATGLLGADPESLQRWADEDVWPADHFGCAGHQGDGHYWAEELGGKIFFGERSHYQLGFDNRLGHYGPYSIIIDQSTPSIWVNTDGERFVAETEERNPRNAAVRHSEDNQAYIIVDSTNEYLDDYYDYLEHHGVAWSSDTIEGLAEQIGVPADALSVTIEEYNADYDAGNGDTEFGVAQEDMGPAKEAPFYAFSVRSLNNATDASVLVDENFQLVREDGTTVENLYFAGSIVVGNYGTMDAGLSHQTALTSGPLVGSMLRHQLLDGEEEQNSEAEVDEETSEDTDDSANE